MFAIFQHLTFLLHIYKHNNEFNDLSLSCLFHLKVHASHFKHLDFGSMYKWDLLYILCLQREFVKRTGTLWVQFFNKWPPWKRITLTAWHATFGVKFVWIGLTILMLIESVLKSKLFHVTSHIAFIWMPWRFLFISKASKPE